MQRYQNIQHCTILIDEPELHLHPVLVFRLVETIRNMGNGSNQLIIFSHSAELISTYYSSGSVYYLDPTIAEGNQAVSLVDLEEQHSTTARLASANLGIFAVARKILFVEGKAASSDRLVYQKLARKVFPELQVFPIGSVRNVNALKDVVDELKTRVFGIDLFLIRDRDGLSEQQVAELETNKHFRCLPRRHVENYLFDCELLSDVARSLYLGDDKYDPIKIEEALKKEATSAVITATVANFKDFVQYSGALQVPRIKALDTKDIAAIKNELSIDIGSSLAIQANDFCTSAIENRIDQDYEHYSSSLTSDKWKSLLPGKPIFASLCGSYFNVDVARMREAYVDKAIEKKLDVFQDILDILTQFRDASVFTS